MKKWLVTGFEPFDGSHVNPSAQIVTALSSFYPTESFHGIILPVETRTAPKVLVEALEAIHPEAVLCLGEAAGRTAVSLERVAINLLDFRIPDNAGEQITDLPIVPDGPVAYFSSLPVRQIRDALLEEGIPVELSYSAGTYLCNQVFYTLMHFLSRHQWNIPAGFVHVPSLPEQAVKRHPLTPSMSVDLEIRAIRTIIQMVEEKTP
ncbi:MAG: pyroglutamyl-peptidase I [Anaerolinea sp.]|jgi:pyroglutamyl-peptidase